MRSGCATQVPSKPSAGLAPLVGSRTCVERARGDLRVAPVRDERAHPADRVRAALVAGRDEQLGVRAHERHRHRDLRAVGQREARSAAAEVLDDREDVVPAAGVEARAVVAQFVEDLLHLERRRDRLDEHRRADRAVRDAERVLGEGEDVVPQPRLEVVLELRQVEVRPGAARDELASRCGRSTARSRRATRMPERSIPARSVYRRCFSTRCQPRGRITIVGVVLADGVALALRRS